MITLSITSFFLYAANKYWYFAPGLTPMGVMRNLPYYYLGYVMGQHQLFRDINPWRDFVGSILCISTSILLFAWHLNAFFAGQHLLHIVLYYPVNVGFLFGVLYGCKLLDSLKSFIITNLSIGTLVIIGLHIVFISGINFVMEHARNIHMVVCYEWYEALSITITIVALLYPIILWAMNCAPILLGKKRT